jgi:hypothetical protein
LHGRVPLPFLGSTAAAISASELRQFGEVDRDPPRPVLKLCRDHQCQYRLKLADIDLRIVSSLFGNDAMRSATTQMPRWATYMGSMTQRTFTHLPMTSAETEEKPRRRYYLYSCQIVTAHPMPTAVATHHVLENWARRNLLLTFLFLTVIAPPPTGRNGTLPNNGNDQLRH